MRLERPFERGKTCIIGYIDHEAYKLQNMGSSRKDESIKEQIDKLEGIIKIKEGVKR